MKPTTPLVGFLTSLVSASPVRETARGEGQAVLQLLTGPDTFLTNDITVPGTFEIAGEFAGATLTGITGLDDEDDVTCQAFSETIAVGESFAVDHVTIFESGTIVSISSVTCTIN